MRLSQSTKCNKSDLDSDDGSDDAPLPIPAVQARKGAPDLLRHIAEFDDYIGSVKSVLGTRKSL